MAGSDLQMKQVLTLEAEYFQFVPLNLQLRPHTLSHLPVGGHCTDHGRTFVWK